MRISPHIYSLWKRRVRTAREKDLYDEMIAAVEAAEDEAATCLLMFRLRMAIRTRNKLHSRALCQPGSSPWYAVYNSRHTQSFIAAVSIPPLAFDDLLRVFSRHYIVKSGAGKRGRPPRFQHKHAVLACVLHFYTAAIEHKSLCILFGIPPSTMQRVLEARWTS